MRYSYLITLLFMFSLSACTATGPAEDGFDTSDGMMPGPGIFSGDKGNWSYSSGKDKKLATETPENTEDFEEFQAFQEWKRNKASSTEEYKDFKDWQEFKAYREWKNKKSDN